MIVSPLLIVSAALHGYVALRLCPALALPAAQVALAVLMLVSAVVVPLGLTGARRPRGKKAWPFAQALTWASLLLMGLFSSLLVLTLLRDAVLLMLWALGAVWPAAPLAAWRGGSAVAVPLLALLATVVGFWNARRTPAVVRVDVPITGLPAALTGFTVAQISDIHVGPTIRRAYLERIVNRVNTLGADVVAITGDLVDGPVAVLAQQVAPLAGLLSRHGTYFVTGNHEYYSGAHAWVAELRRLGLTVLLNEHVVLHHNDATLAMPDAQEDAQLTAQLVLAGVTDFSAHHFDEAHRSDPKAALEGAPPAAPVRVLLAHQPRSAQAAQAAGFDLQLSGHTHGGQFYPWNWFVRLQQPYVSGLSRLQGLWVYTSRGTGYWGPPKRFGAPSEITLLRLVAG